MRCKKRLDIRLPYAIRFQQFSCLGCRRVHGVQGGTDNVNNPHFGSKRCHRQRRNQ